MTNRIKTGFVYIYPRLGTPSKEVVCLDILNRAAAVRTCLELRLTVLVRRLGDVSKLQQVRPSVLGQDRAGLVWNLRKIFGQTKYSLLY